MATGNIAAVGNSTVVINEKESARADESTKRTFAVRAKTRKNGVLREGASVTVYYRRQGDVAEQIDLTEALKGLLVPGDRPNLPLPSSCSRIQPLPPNALRIYLGGNAEISTAEHVTVLNVRGIEVLALRRTSNGLAINAKTFSEDGKIVAEIIDNQFYVNPNNFFRMDKPDSHSLVVYDGRDRKVLDIKYLNPHSVSILGIFRVPGALPLTIGETELSLGGSISTGSCFSGATLFRVS